MHYVKLFCILFLLTTKCSNTWNLFIFRIFVNFRSLASKESLKLLFLKLSKSMKYVKVKCSDLFLNNYNIRTLFLWYEITKLFSWGLYKFMVLFIPDKAKKQIHLGYHILWQCSISDAFQKQSILWPNG